MTQASARSENETVLEGDRGVNKVLGLVDEVSRRARYQVSNALDTMKKNPLTTLATIFAGGMVAAALLSRRG